MSKCKKYKYSKIKAYCKIKQRKFIIIFSDMESFTEYVMLLTGKYGEVSILPIAIENINGEIYKIFVLKVL